MAITLAEAKVGMSDHVDQQVIDEFRRGSFLLDKLIFDNSISPGTGGSTLSYGYIQLLSPSTAGVRKINTEYTSSEAKRTKKSADAIIIGGKYSIDRVLIGTAGAVDELAFQQSEKIKATKNEFHNLVINGNGADEGAGVLNTFDGLDKILTGSETEITSVVDVSTSELMDSNHQALLDEVDEFLSILGDKPDMLMMHNKMKTKLRSAARRAGYYSKTRDEFGRTVENYNDIPMIDLGQYFDGKKSIDIIPVNEGKTDIYAVKIALDGFHGISPTGTKVIEMYNPNLDEPGAVKDGEVELVAGTVLKNSKKAGVLRGVKVDAA